MERVSLKVRGDYYDEKKMVSHNPRHFFDKFSIIYIYISIFQMHARDM